MTNEPLAEQLHRWVNRLNTLLMDGARLKKRAQVEEVELDAVSQTALRMYERINAPLRGRGVSDG